MLRERVGGGMLVRASNEGLIHVDCVDMLHNAR